MSMEPHTHSHTHRHNAHNPSITISSFEVSGNHKTQLALFENEFAQSCEAKKFHELEGELSVALQRMREMDLFSSVDTQVRVLTPEKERASGSGDTKIAVLVVVKEKNMPSLKAETFFGNEGNNVGASIQGQLRNLTGFGDLLKLSYGTNSAGSKDTHLTYTIPSVTRKLHSLDFITRIYDDNSLSTFSSFHKNALSMAASLTTVDRRHKLTLQSVIRDEVPVPSSIESSNLASSTPSNILSNVNANNSNQSSLSNPSFFGLLQSINTVHKHTSPAVLALLSPSTKTSLTYSHTKDSRDSSSHPTKGSLFSSSVELAVPPGSAQYVRADISLEKHSTLLASKRNPSQRIVGSLCGSFATTRVLDFTSLWSTDISDRDDNNVHINGKGERKLCHMSDRLFLGGPLSLRGLNLNGAGPRSFRRSPTDSASIEPGLMSKPPDVGDALGGLTKITALAALSSPLPFSHQAAENIKTILFLNGAVLLPHTVFPLAAPNSATHSDILSCLRLSVGAGLSYSMGPVRLELTYALPLLTSSHDNTKSFQIGVALGMNSS